MAEAQSTSYDEVPYASHVFYYSHPDRLATMGRLLGLRPEPVDRCRVLEIGCGTGANLIPMACAFPGSTFIGIDLSARQIDMGRDIVGKLGLTNIELAPRNIMEVDGSLGKFDYLLCHGVYSWVPPDVQDRILRVCRELLSPAGIAYVSYNTYPGWHRRRMIREMMRYHVEQFTDPAERVQQARAILDFLIESVGDPKSAYGVILQAEADMLKGTADSYIFHEHLEDNNDPVYFHEFARRAAAHGLQYLTEAQPTPLASNLSPKVRETLEKLSVDLIRAEQYMDFVRNRTFRRSLLCHAETPVKRPPSADAIAGMYVTTLVKPASDARDLDPNVAAEFATEKDARLRTNNPLLKATLWKLWDSWPRAVPLAELWEGARARIADEYPAALADLGDADTDGRLLLEPLLQCFLADMVELQVEPGRFVTQVSRRPTASPLARLQAAQGADITNLRHRTVILNGFERQLVTLLDGSRDEPAVMEALLDSLARGELEIEQDGQPLRDPAKARELFGAALGPTLNRLARLALFVG